MTAVSATIKIDNDDWATIASLAGITLSSGKSYSIQVRGEAFIKIADAEFDVSNKDITVTQGADNIYIKPNGSSGTCVIAILENA